MKYNTGKEAPNAKQETELYDRRVDDLNKLREVAGLHTEIGIHCMVLSHKQGEACGSKSQLYGVVVYC